MLIEQGSKNPQMSLNYHFNLKIEYDLKSLQMVRAVEMEHPTSVQALESLWKAIPALTMCHSVFMTPPTIELSCVLLLLLYKLQSSSINYPLVSST